MWGLRFAPYEPVEFVWNPKLRHVFDPALLLEELAGAEFADLFVNEFGLLLYTRGNPILWFYATRARETNDDFLYGVLGE